ncbi:PREDICTED: myosin-binding protein 1 isoform X2 [Ipomoea nil]|uniref:myosin-binding protein 1 isoform X2 n=1 Tax=Ipomoea nil TaxID=35883 RepID=UPI0009010C1F|nr:PREDICTED: myosin-binding protein 1 isoform X2 [Ipomoea nil]
MESEANYMWSLSSLAGSFLDLAIAFFCLCVSAAAFFTFKFLGFCGLGLPYPPCNWLFGISRNDIQKLQRLLSGLATEKVSNVKLSVKERCHYNAQNVHLNLRLIGERDDVLSHNGHGFVEMEVEAQSSPGSDGGLPRNADRMEFMPIDHCRLFSSSRYDPQYVELQDDQQCHSRIDDERNGMSEDSEEVFSNGTYPCSNDAGFGPRDSFKLDENVFPDDDDDDEHSENDLFIREDLNGNVQVDEVYNANDMSAIRFLEKALEEEKAARDALCLELEKERNAAASAADEAMAMISRLQGEKASIEMEAKQYKRIIEEKSAYEADEMEVMKEILVRRETEKHFLEREVEAYRQMVYLGNQHFAVDNEKLKNLDHGGEKVQLKLLEDIACQLQEIRQLTLNEDG